MTANDERDSFETVDVTRRTRLAVERTFLSWLRTGLTAFAVALAAGRLVPVLTDNGASWPYEVLGSGFAVLGIACVLYGEQRRREVDRALAEHRFVPPDGRISLALTVLGALLGAGLIAVVIAQG